MKLAILLALIGGSAGAVETVWTVPAPCPDLWPHLTDALQKSNFEARTDVSRGGFTFLDYTGRHAGWLAGAFVRRYTTSTRMFDGKAWNDYAGEVSDMELTPAAGGCRIRLEFSHAGLLEVGAGWSEWRDCPTNGKLEAEVRKDLDKLLRKNKLLAATK